MANAAMERVIGGPEGLSGKYLRDFVSPELFAKIEEIEISAMESWRPALEEVCLPSPRGN